MKEYLYRVLKAIHFGRNPHLEGTAGAGKTALTAWVARLLKQPYLPLVCKETDTARQYFGWHDADGFHYGAIPQMSEKRGILALDEYYHLRSSVVSGFNSVFDHQRALSLTDGRRIKMEPESVRITMSNPPGDEYGAVQAHSQAERSRHFTIWVRPPDDKEEQEIVEGVAQRLKLKKPVADAAMAVHRWVKQQFADRDHGILGRTMDEDELPNFTVSEPTRVVRAVAKFRDEYHADPKEAFPRGVELAYLQSPAQEENDAVVAYATGIKIP
jgi:MoxR-like ATPase